MNLDAQDYLRLVENNNTLCFFDIESTGLKGDYGTILCVSVKPYHGDAVTFSVKQMGNDQKVVREAADFLASFDCWVSYYGKGFDKPMLNTRLLRWKQEKLVDRHHIDLYFTLKAHTVMSRRSMAQYAGLLEIHDQKMGVSPNVWTDILANPDGPAMKTMITRCESDCKTLQGVYEETKHIIKEIKK